MARGLRAKLVATAQQMGMAADAAEDVAQDTLLRLWTMHGELDRVRSLAAFATRMAQHRCLDMLRRQQPLPIEGRTVEDTRHSQPDMQLQAADDEAWLMRRMQALPTAERQVLRLRQVELKTNEEIALPTKRAWWWPN